MVQRLLSNSELYLSPRGTAGRLPTDYDMNLSAAYDFRAGPLTITPTLYVFNLLNRQTPNDVVQTFNPNGAFVSRPGQSLFWAAGTGARTGKLSRFVSGAVHGRFGRLQKSTQRLSPRLLRLALKITF